MDLQRKKKILFQGAGFFADCIGVSIFQGFGDVI